MAGEDTNNPIAHTAENDATFIGSSALLTALYDTYVEHIGIAEPDGPDGPYMWCACGWRSDDLGPNENPGNSYAVHLTNAQHAAAVKALQPIVRRVLPPGEGDKPSAEKDVGDYYCPSCRHPWDYHHETRGCTMPLNRLGLLAMRTDEIVRSCACSVTPPGKGDE